MAADDTRPATLMPGIQGVHFAISTRREEAQKFFDQGLAFVYAFNHEEAVRSFRRAAELDPGVADAALGHRAGAGAEHQPATSTARARRRPTKPCSKRVALARPGAGERAGLRRRAGKALFERSESRPEGAGGAIQGRDGRSSTRTYPNDLDAATLYAESLMDLHPWQLYAADGTPTEGTERDRRGAGVGARARTRSRRRESLLHPRHRGLARRRSGR